MTIAAFATGCEHGWVYLRGEYPRALGTLERARSTRRAAAGFLGDDILGSPGSRSTSRSFRGAGAYICGEETAIFNSIEGYRGEPRNKPPFPVEVGLFGKPTVVNNVETLVNVLPILPAVAGVRRARHRGVDGRKLFCVSGAVARPGVYEVEFGVTLGELIELAGGVRGGARLQAVLLGGAAGGVRRSRRARPAADDRGRARARARRSARASCSCSTTPSTWSTSCAGSRPSSATSRAGSACRAASAPCARRRSLARLAGEPRATATSQLFADLAQVMRDASICGLGQTAPNAIESAIDRLGVFR